MMSSLSEEDLPVWQLDVYKRQLYAVWAEDRNGNNQADYTETLSQLLYSENALNDGIVPVSYTHLVNDQCQ